MSIECKISRLKRKLKKVYTEYNRELDGYSCGANLARNINPRTPALEQKMLQIKTTLKSLGEIVPRLPFEPL